MSYCRRDRGKGYGSPEQAPSRPETVLTNRNPLCFRFQGNDITLVAYQTELRPRESKTFEIAFKEVSARLEMSPYNPSCDWSSV